MNPLLGASLAPLLHNLSEGKYTSNDIIAIVIISAVIFVITMLIRKNWPN